MSLPRVTLWWVAARKKYQTPWKYTDALTVISNSEPAFALWVPRECAFLSRLCISGGICKNNLLFWVVTLTLCFGVSDSVPRADGHPLRSNPVTPWGSAGGEGQEMESDSLTRQCVSDLLILELELYLLPMPKCLPLPHKVHSHRSLWMFTTQQLLMQIQMLSD